MICRYNSPSFEVVRYWRSQGRIYFVYLARTEVSRTLQAMAGNDSNYTYRGRIHLIRGNPRANLEADVIFEHYQNQAAGGALAFQRYPMRAVRYVTKIFCHCIISLTGHARSINVTEPHLFWIQLTNLFRSRHIAHQLLFSEL